MEEGRESKHGVGTSCFEMNQNVISTSKRNEGRNNKPKTMRTRGKKDKETAAKVENAREEHDGARGKAPKILLEIKSTKNLLVKSTTP